jgi:hypothetical protein
MSMHDRLDGVDIIATQGIVPGCHRIQFATMLNARRYMRCWELTPVPFA